MSTPSHTHLLPGKDVLVEVVLDLLIGDVDAQLLKGVDFKVLKAKDVQDADVGAIVAVQNAQPVGTPHDDCQHSLHCFKVLMW